MCEALAPELTEVIRFDSKITKATWFGALTNGKSLEVLAICSLISASKRSALSVRIPEIYLANPEIFYLQNRLPLSTPVKPGHSADSMEESIENRFLATFTPKFEIHDGNRIWSIFKEGIPSIAIEQYLQTGEISTFRPDIAILEGTGYTTHEGSILTYTWTQGAKSASYQMRVVDAPMPKILDYVQGNPGNTQILGLIECSINKTKAHLDSQIEKYIELFGPKSSNAVCYYHLNGKPSDEYGYNFSAASILENDQIKSENTLSGFTTWLKRTLQLSI